MLFMVDYTNDSNYNTVDEIIYWLHSEEGRRECLEVIKEADRLYERSEEARRIPPELMDWRATI